MNVVIIGANSGIGQAMVSALLERFPQARIQATWNRTPMTITHNRVSTVQLDVTDEAQIIGFAKQAGEVDWLINTVGLLHTQERGPEKTIRSFEGDFFQENIRTNVLPTILLAKHFNNRLNKTRNSVFATLSAKVGSIEDNRLGGWTSYRCSKAALNMAIKNISIEWSRKKVAVVALHPGTTDTPLSKPFQNSVPDGKLFSSAKTANLLLDVINDLTPEHTGQFLAYDGVRIPW